MIKEIQWIIHFNKIIQHFLVRNLKIIKNYQKNYHLYCIILIKVNLIIKNPLKSFHKRILLKNMRTKFKIDKLWMCLISKIIVFLKMKFNLKSRRQLAFHKNRISFKTIKIKSKISNIKKHCLTRIYLILK